MGTCYFDWHNAMLPILLHRSRQLELLACLANELQEPIVAQEFDRGLAGKFCGVRIVSPRLDLE